MSRKLRPQAALTVHSPRIAIVTFAFAATAFLPALESASTGKEAATKVTEEIVHVRSDDGITNGGAVFVPSVQSASPIAVIWIPGSRVNFYYPTT